MDPNIVKIALVALLNAGAIVLVALGKIAWSDAKDIMIWSVGPLLVVNGIQNAATNLGKAHLEATKLRFPSSPPPAPPAPSSDPPSTKPEKAT